jgi:hypothetical protein
MRRSRSDPAVVITTAPESTDDDYDHRRKRYALMMAGRAACVIAAALTYRVSIVLALVLIVGGAILPWCAVILANDRPPKKRQGRRFRGTPGERALPSGQDDRVIDG